MPFVVAEDLGALDYDLLHREARRVAIPGYDAVIDGLSLEEWGVVSGFDDGLGSLKKKLKKAVRKVTKPIKAIHKKITPKPLQKIEKKVSEAHKKVYTKAKRVHEKVVRPVLMKYVVPVAGAVLAPFTFGASALAATLITTGYKAYETRQQMKVAVTKQKKALAAEEAKYNAEFDAKANELYQQSASTHFLPLGYTPDVWAKMTRDQKLQLVEALQKGTATPYSAGATGMSLPTTAASGSSSSVSVSRPSGGGGGAPGVTSLAPDAEGMPQEVAVGPSTGTSSAGGGGGGGLAVAAILLAMMGLG